MSHSTRSRSRSRSHTRSPSRVDMEDIDVNLESRQKPKKDRFLTRKRIRGIFNTLGKASQPVTSGYLGADKVFGMIFNKYMTKGTRKNQVDIGESATEIPEAYQVLSTGRSRSRGGKKNRRKTHKNKHKK